MCQLHHLLLGLRRGQGLVRESMLHLYREIDYRLLQPFGEAMQCRIANTHLAALQFGPMRFA